MISPNDYQKNAFSFAAYGDNATYAYAGLAEEAGEVLGKFAKFIRKHDGIEPSNAANWETLKSDIAEYREAIKKELGDVLWMVAAIATHEGLRLDDIMESNIRKLEDRLARGTIIGEGDNR
jgi:NTP pyrophosphatase (non-canonical NTP hydrolase)